MAIKSQAQLTSDIQTHLADNNAGLISAADVRENMVNIVDSINVIVGSGNFDSQTPFTAANVRAKIVNSQYGLFVAESGVNFPNGGGTQYVPYPGPQGISHTGIADLTVGNPHTQYLHVNGWNRVTGNLPMGNRWINSSGNIDQANTTFNDRGFKFTYVDSNNETISVGNKSTMNFDVDNSKIFSAKGVAQAWIRFQGTSGNLVVNSSYNVSGIHHINNGYYKVFFKPLTFNDATYLALGNSNSTTGSGSPQDFDLNTVGIIERTKDYLTFVVRNDNGEYVNARVNDLVVYGNASGVTASSSPTIVNI
jgi:hypothetical protein